MPSKPSRPLQALAALVFLVSVLVALILAEEPSGRVEGTAVSEVTGIKLAGARIVLTNLDEEAPVQVRRARADKNGQFHLENVPTGIWELSASTQAHSGSNFAVRVEEGKTTPISVEMQRSQPEFEAAPVQRTFATQSKPFIPLRGYVDHANDAAHLKVYKAKFSTFAGNANLIADLQKTGNRYETVPVIPASLTTRSELVREWDQPLDKADAEGFYQQRVPLPANDPGLYLIQASHGKETACSWINVTDLALVTKKGRPYFSPKKLAALGNAPLPSEVLVYVADIKTGRPVQNARVSSLAQQPGVALPGPQFTSPEGLARFFVPPGGEVTYAWIAAANGSEGVLLNNVQGGQEEGGSDHVATYTDRPIYRPGDTIYFKGIVRQKDGRTNRYSIPAGEPVSVELRDDSGQRLNVIKTSTNRFGSYWGAATLSSEASPGYYTLLTTIDGQETSTDVQVSAYRKPEMAVEVHPDQEQIIRGVEASMTVEAKFYFGSPVAGGHLTYELYKEPNYDGLTLGGEDEDDFEDYEGGDYYGEYVSDGEATLDAAGKAVIKFPTILKKDPEAKDEEESQASGTQSETWSLRATVTDAADRQAEGSGQLDVVAGDFHLGMSLDGSLGAPGTAKIVTLQATAYDTEEPVSAQSVSLQWSYEKWNAETEAVEYEPVGSLSGTTNDLGRTTLEITPPRSGQLKITASARDRGGRTISTDSYLWVISPGEDAADYGNLGSLELLTDQKHYKAGDKARVLINAAEPAAAALLTIEGDRLYRAWTVPLKGKSTEFSFALEEDYGPNVTLSACFIRDGKYVTSEVPLRVKVPNREIQVAIQPDAATHRPGDKVKYTVTTKDAAGKPVPSEFSLAVVDEAIFALAQDDPKLLQDTFYPRRENSIETKQSLEVEYLGDVDKTSPNIRARRRFVDTAYWLPEGHTDGTGKAEISFNLPDNLTEWRATVFAQTADSSFGYGKSSVTSAKPFMVRLDKPRFAVEGDVFRLLATIHNETGAAQQATVKLESAELTNSDDASKPVSLQPGENQVVEWRVTAGAADADIKVSAWTSDQKFTDAVEETLPVRPYGREVVTRQSGTMKGETPLRFAITGDPGRAHVKVRLAPSPLDAIATSFDYLLDYPYGCVEQTSSRMYPDLLAKRLLRLTGRRDLIDAKKEAELSKMVADGIVRLTKMQHEDGAWGWWDYDKSDPFLSGYALSTLAMARDEGFAVPEQVMKRGVDSVLQMASAMPQPYKGETKYGFDYRRKSWVQNQPWLLLAAARAGGVDKACEVRAGINLGALNNAALANAALLDAELGTGRDAYEMFLQRAGEDAGTMFWKDERPHWETDQDTTSVTAMGLQVLLAYNQSDPRATKALQFLMARRTGECWESTRDTALVLAALVDYVHAVPAAAEPSGSTSLEVNGKPWSALDVNAPHEKLTLEPPRSMLHQFDNGMTLKARGGYYALEVRETKPFASGQNLAPIVSQGVKVSRELLSVMPMLPGKLTPPLQPVRSAIHSGDSVTVRLTIESPRDLAYVQIEDIFAAGCEPTQRGSADVSSGDEWDYWWDATVVRDDRIAFFARTLSKGKHVIEYTLRAQTPGQYRVLPAFLAPMYAPEVRAESGEAALTIE